MVQGQDGCHQTGGEQEEVKEEVKRGRDGRQGDRGTAIAAGLGLSLGAFPDVS